MHRPGFSDRSLQTRFHRREAAARHAARLVNRYTIPGVEPLSLREKLWILVLALVIALTPFGMAGLVLPPRF